MTAQKTNTQVILDFCALWSKLDASLAAPYFTDDVVFLNVPFGAVTGRDTVVKVNAGFIERVNFVHFEVLNIAEHGDVVLTERVDRFTTKAGKEFALPVMGAFQMKDGKIAEWRDYFDSKGIEGL